MMWMQDVLRALMALCLVGIANGEGEMANNVWLGACIKGLQMSGYDPLKTEDYAKWYNDDSVYQLAQTGTFRGVEDIKEYVEYTKAPFFDFFTKLDSQAIPIAFGEEG